MNCEYCALPMDHVWGSGRFHGPKCARAFSTREKRAEINERVSTALTGRASSGRPFQHGFDARRVATPESRAKSQTTRTHNRAKKYAKTPFEQLPHAEQRRRVFAEQAGKCLWCGNDSTWRGAPLVLELDHVNGEHEDNRRENLRFLCPNCHSQTPTYRNYKRHKN